MTYQPGDPWRVANSINVLRQEVNTAHPGRPTASDGTIGDAAHQQCVSDHNPNSAGVVTAWDITADTWSDALAENFRMRGSTDSRVKYVIWQRRITSAMHNWQWVAYNGEDPHTSHIHLSVSADPSQYDRTDPWGITDVISRTLFQGESGDDVRAIQGRLNSRFGFFLIIDGEFGPKTTQAVESFQAREGLSVDGVVGPQTCKALGFS